MAFKTVKPDSKKFKVKEPVANDDYGAEVTRLEVRALKALEYALAGKSPKDIGPLLDPPTNAAGVRAILRAEIADRKDDLTENLREKEIMRLDRHRNYLSDRAFGYTDEETGEFIPGDGKWHRLLLEVDVEFRKLVGINAAQEIKISDAITSVLEIVKDIVPAESYIQVLSRLNEADSSGTIRDLAARATAVQAGSGAVLN